MNEESKRWVVADDEMSTSGLELLAARTTNSRRDGSSMMVIKKTWYAGLRSRQTDRQAERKNERLTAAGDGVGIVTVDTK